MADVVCLIADPTRVPLEQAVVSGLCRALGGTEHWLAEAEACDILVEDAARREILARLAAALPEPSCDVAVLPAKERRKRLLVSDMDSTMITVECIDELADYLGVKPEVSAITRRAMNGELDFVAALRARVALLEGLPVDVFDEVFRERVKVMPGARTLVRTMHAWGARAALVSGGFVPFAERVRAAIGFDIAQANRLETLNGRLTGRLLGPVRSPESKLALLRQLTRVLRLRPAETLAVGDGANDLPMLEAASLGVAFRPSPAVAAVAPIAVRWGDLTALLYLQGVAKSGFQLG
ncbi:MAG: phosphoserine phosphatase SerB [Geminicoccaceae bacterium]